MTLGSRDAVFLEPQGFVKTQAGQKGVLSSSQWLEPSQGECDSGSTQIEKCTTIPRRKPSATSVFIELLAQGLKRPDALGIPFHNHRNKTALRGGLQLVARNSSFNLCWLLPYKSIVQSGNRQDPPPSVSGPSRTSVSCGSTTSNPSSVTSSTTSSSLSTVFLAFVPLTAAAAWVATWDGSRRSWCDGFKRFYRQDLRDWRYVWNQGHLSLIFQTLAQMPIACCACVKQPFEVFSFLPLAQNPSCLSGFFSKGCISMSIWSHFDGSCLQGSVVAHARVRSHASQAEQPDLKTKLSRRLPGLP